MSLRTTPPWIPGNRDMNRILLCPDCVIRRGPRLVMGLTMPHRPKTQCNCSWDHACLHRVNLCHPDPIQPIKAIVMNRGTGLLTNDYGIIEHTTDVEGMVGWRRSTNSLNYERFDGLRRSLKEAYPTFPSSELLLLPPSEGRSILFPKVHGNSNGLAVSGHSMIRALYNSIYSHIDKQLPSDLTYPTMEKEDWPPNQSQSLRKVG